jgi:acetylornithine deacetylase
MSGQDTLVDARPPDVVDQATALATLQGAIRHASITGAEASFAGYLAALLQDLRMDEVMLSEFLPGRPNVVGIKRGSGGGKRLLIIGHTDVVHVHGWRERWTGDVREDPFGAAVVDGAVWGRGSADLKAGIAMSIEAVRAVIARSARLAGDVVLAFVGDEESGEPGTGVSAGMKALVQSLDDRALPQPDMAIYVEPTTLDIYPAQMGFFIAEIEVTGRSAYFGVPEQGVDALKATHAILAALWGHSAVIGARGAHPLVGRSFLLVTAIAGGGLIAVPGRCTLSLIRKLRPGEDLDAAQSELEAAVRNAVADREIRLAFVYPAGRDHPIGGRPSEIDPANEAVRLLQATVQRRRPDRGKIKGAPFWSEASFLTARGIPTVYFAPGDISICHTSEEHVAIDEYLSGIAALAEFIEGYCGAKT